MQDGAYNLTIYNGTVTIVGASVTGPCVEMCVDVSKLSFKNKMINVGLIHGTVTLVQLLVNFTETKIPNMIVADKPFRLYRGLSIDINSGYPHTIDDFKSYIDLCRFYKMTVLTFNTGQEKTLNAEVCACNLICVCVCVPKTNTCARALQEGTIGLAW